MNFFSPSSSRPGTSPRFRTRDVSMCMGSPTARRPLVAKPFQREDVAFLSSNWIGTSKFDRFADAIMRSGSSPHRDYLCASSLVRESSRIVFLSSAVAASLSRIALVSAELTVPRTVAK
jgi:hypothetical protein